MSEKEWHLITLKFGGYWSKVKSTDRKRYEGGRQKTIKIDKDVLCFFVLIEEVEEICPWLRGRIYELHYHLHGTSPKEYELIRGDVEVIEMVRLSGESGRAEVLIVVQEEMNPKNDQRNCVDDVVCLQRGEVMDDNQVMDEVASDVALSVGARFANAKSFKHFLRTKAIEENFGLKITTSDRKRVVASCSHQECPWRVRATLCMDGETFEVRKLEASHSCPGVNRTGNKHATRGKDQWVVVDDGVQVGLPNTIRPRGRPKKRRFKNFLETGNRKSKRLHKCGRCGLLGHHKSSCKNPLSQASQDMPGLNSFASEAVDMSYKL